VVSEISENTLRKKRVERMVAQIVNGLRPKRRAPPPPSADEDTPSKRTRRSNTCDENMVNNSKPKLPSKILAQSAAGGAATTSKRVPLGEFNRGDDNVPAIGTVPSCKAPIPPANLAFGRSIPSPLPNCSPNVRMQYMVAEELLSTEEAYVASLHYVIEHYLSEMDRTDLPYQLAGQRSTIFGNIEKIYEFHIGQFLPELKRNCSEANDALGAQVAKSFLKFRSEFHLYALYSKNKPKSDELMAKCAGVFFQIKQLELQDNLGLSSYLLKPVQRMFNYVLLLQRLIKACPTDDQEQMETLKAAEELVTFQLRHGNDLLAMDAIRRCDKNLEDQGRLLLQDEFVVEKKGLFSRKRVHRVFLFEHLVLFSEAKRIRGANDVEHEIYESKRFIKMSEAGMTEQVGDSELKFELWNTSCQRFILQASSPSVRSSWIVCIKQLLFKQMVRKAGGLSFPSYEPKAEATSMGGNMCMDLKPSKDRIEDRALNASSFLQVPKVRYGRSVSDTDIANSQNKRPHSLISASSSSASSSNVSSTESNGFHVRAASVMETGRNSSIRTTSTESGICCEFNRSEASSSMISDVGQKLGACKENAGSECDATENVDGATL